MSHHEPHFLGLGMLFITHRGCLVNFMKIHRGCLDGCGGRPAPGAVGKQAKGSVQGQSYFTTNSWKILLAILPGGHSWSWSYHPLNRHRMVQGYVGRLPPTPSSAKQPALD